MVRARLKDWLRRYWLAEAVGTLAALATGLLTYALADNAVLTAYLGTWGENLGFYGVMLVGDVSKSVKHRHAQQLAYGPLPLARDIRNLVVEFGPAELLDSTISRPLLMYLGQEVFGNVAVGLIAGKVVADAIFYVPAIVAYELRRRYF